MTSVPPSLCRTTGHVHAHVSLPTRQVGRCCPKTWLQPILIAPWGGVCHPTEANQETSAERPGSALGPAPRPKFHLLSQSFVLKGGLHRIHGAKTSTTSKHSRVLSPGAGYKWPGKTNCCDKETKTRGHQGQRCALISSHPLLVLAFLPLLLSSSVRVLLAKPLCPEASRAARTPPFHLPSAPAGLPCLSGQHSTILVLPTTDN